VDVRPLSNRTAAGRSSTATSTSGTPSWPRASSKSAIIKRELNNLKPSSGFVEVSTTKSRLNPLFRSSTVSSTSSSSKASTSSKPTQILNRSARETICLDESDSETLPHKAPYQVVQNQIKQDAIQAQWDAAVKVAKAAPINIVNEVDDTTLPLPKDFEYLEQGYHFTDTDNRDEFLSGCDCPNGSCKYPQDCCLDLMGVDKPIFPYTEEVSAPVYCSLLMRIPPWCRVYLLSTFPGGSRSSNAIRRVYIAFHSLNISLISLVEVPM